LTEGTVIGGSFAVESFAELDAVLDAVRTAVSVDDAAAVMVCGVDETD
jgi:hypothetical protein